MDAKEDGTVEEQEEDPGAGCAARGPGWGHVLRPALWHCCLQLLIPVVHYVFHPALTISIGDLRGSWSHLCHCPMFPETVGLQVEALSTFHSLSQRGGLSAH